MSQRQRHELASQRLPAAVEWFEHDVGERDKGALRSVQIVGQAAAVAVAPHAQSFCYPVAVGLDRHPLAAIVACLEQREPMCRNAAILGRMADDPRWYTVRRAQNRKPATYRCPFCGRHLPALSEHMLIAPEGDSSHRRHAHTECVLAARRAGRLPTRDEWLKTQPRAPSLWRRVLARVAGVRGTQG